MLGRKKTLWQVTVCLFIVFTMLISSCSPRNAAYPGQPVEPTVPGEDVAQTQVEGRFTIRTPEVQILGLSLSADGSMVAVGSAARTVYLLERNGKQWEKSLNSLPLQTLLEPAGKYLAVGTSGGKIIILNMDQSVRQELTLGAPVGLLVLSGDEELFLAGLFPEDAAEADKVVVLDKYLREKWTFETGVLLDAKLGGPDNRVFVNWKKSEDQPPQLSAFSAEGELLWQEPGKEMVATTVNGRFLATTEGQDICLYSLDGQKCWSYGVTGRVKSLQFAESGMYLAALVKDEATQKEELLYMNIEGDLIWSSKMPDDSQLLVSRDGRRVISSSWRQYRDDATHILVFNHKGQEVNKLEIAGKVQVMALQSDSLVLGLEDGNIFFLNISQSQPGDFQVLAGGEGQKLEFYYRPVSFKREKDEGIVTLYFYDENAEELVPVSRRVPLTQALYRVSIEELVKGPVQSSNLQRTIPKDTEIHLHFNEQQEGQIVIDLPKTLDEMSGTTFLSGVLESLLLTVSQFPTIKEVRFTVGGSPQETFGQDGLVIGEPIIPSNKLHTDREKTIYLPHRSGVRYYLLPVLREFLPLKEKALAEAIVKQIMNEADSFFVPGLRIKDITFEKETVYLNFSEEFLQLTWPNHPEMAARAAVIRDSIALSLAGNLPEYRRVVFLVDNKPPRKPEEFLPWELVVYNPFYINPED